jgi:hypothetical protein
MLDPPAAVDPGADADLATIVAPKDEVDEERQPLVVELEEPILDRGVPCFEIMHPSHLPSERLPELFRRA